MEDDDDEFGDLYADVLRPFSSYGAPQPPLFSSSSVSSANPPQDLNLHSHDDAILYGAPHPNFPLPSKPINQNLVSDHHKVEKDQIPCRISDAELNWNGIDRVQEQEQENAARVSDFRILDLPKVDATRVLKVEDVEVEAEDSRVFEALEPCEKSGIGKVKIEEGDKDDVFMEKVDIFSGDEMEKKLEIDMCIGDMESEPVIPGISSSSYIPGVFDGAEKGGDVKASRGDDTGGGGDSWDSDSEDDLQIVLNDSSGPLGMNRNEGAGSDDEDEEDLIIVADVDQHHQTLEDQEWGEDSAQAADGERKETGDTEKANGGMVIAVGARIGHINHGYHPHHSQFKYVRPGATAMPGGAIVGPGGAPGQVRPLVNVGPIAGRGRGDWRPIGIKAAPIMQKNFHSGFGLSVWGNNSSGRGFGSGLEFTLPSHKTVFDIDIDSFEEKPWRHPGVDTTDFFNFGLDEENWKDYFKQLARINLSLQSLLDFLKDYDPDLPPELAAAAGIHDVKTENAHIGKIEVAQGDFIGQGRGAAHTRPPLPTGRAIQVEGGYGERLPSIDTRPPRIRDSDAVIEIVLEDSVDDSITANGVLEQLDNDPQGEDLKRGHEVEEDIEQTENEYFDNFPQTYNGSKREMMGRGAPFIGSVQNNLHEGDGILPFPPEVSLRHHPGSKGQTPVNRSGIFGTPHEGRWPQDRARGRYPYVTTEHGNDAIPSQNARGKRYYDNQKKSRESIDGKQSPQLSSPVTVVPEREPSVEQKDDVHNELISADIGNIVEGEEMALDTIVPNHILEDEILLHSIKKQKLSSRVEQPAVQDFGDGDDLMVTRSSDTSKARSGSSRDYQKQRDGGEEEVVQDGRSRRMADVKRCRDEDEHSFRRRDDYSRDGRQEMDRNRVVVKGREDSYHSYPHRDWDPNSGNYSHQKTDRPKERSNSVGAWQRRDEDTHVRRVKDEDLRKQDRVEEMGSRHRSKVRESEKSDKDENLHSRKRLDNGDWRGRPDKDVRPRHRERDDNLMRHENLDDPHTKRRKDEEHHRREQAGIEESLHGYRAREDTSHRKRERGDFLDQPRRDDQPRVRDKPDDPHSVRHREESWRQRLKTPHEDTLSKREREGRGAVRNGRGVEDKPSFGNARSKEEPKGSDKDRQFKDKKRHSEQPKRRDQVEDGTLSHYRGREDVYGRENQFSNEERSSRQERSSTHNDLAVNASNSQGMHKDRHKENMGKSKEPEGVDQNIQGHAIAKRKQEDRKGHQNEKTNGKRGKCRGQPSASSPIPSANSTKVGKNPSVAHSRDLVHQEGVIISVPDQSPQSGRVVGDESYVGRCSPSHGGFGVVTLYNCYLSPLKALGEYLSSPEDLEQWVSPKSVDRGDLCNLSVASVEALVCEDGSGIVEVDQGKGTGEIMRSGVNLNLVHGNQGPFCLAEATSRGSSKNCFAPHPSLIDAQVSMKVTSKRESGTVQTLGPTDSRNPAQLRSPSSTAFSKSRHEHEIPQQRHSSKKHKEDAPSDGEQQDSRKGRSKLERWTSQKEIDDKVNAQSSSLSKAKETDKNYDQSLASEQREELAKTVESFDNQHTSGEDGNEGDHESKDADAVPMTGSQHVDSDKMGEDRHLDTAEKLKKRSERFKLPLPSEKDTMANRKTESETLLSSQSETATEAEIKQERPARKRRWISN
ncbi:hypothetical protein HHK36_006354 [Tetracentron sinense]|uniref:Pre-mRNA polyadenylation factor Fip1 domain-containing protein n=1 Tax=Tetracentron sinense TaxID=13715 RepID=A0A834ZRN3_TETSI|nr:hypothetical protein HHK36_006354 [Tetracentron sinense]